MMRMYTYSLLKKLSPEDERPIEDKEILAWANSKLSMKLTSFQDKKVRSAHPVLEIIEAMKPRTKSRADNLFFSYVVGPGFLLALLLQGQVFCWP